MAQYSELVLFLLERKSSSLTSLFEDAQEVEENMCASRRTREQADFENPHLPEPTECRYGSDFDMKVMSVKRNWNSSKHVSLFQS
jgi:hypothetical protein